MADPRPPTRLVVGPFDMLHVGHLRLLAAPGPDAVPLVVGVLDDELCRRLLGAAPFMPDIERAELVGGLASVDRAVLLRTVDLTSLITEFSIIEVLVDPQLEPGDFLTGSLGADRLPELGSSVSGPLRAALNSRVPVPAARLPAGHA